MKCTISNSLCSLRLYVILKHEYLQRHLFSFIQRMKLLSKEIFFEIFKEFAKEKMNSNFLMTHCIVTLWNIHFSLLRNEEEKYWIFSNKSRLYGLSLLMSQKCHSFIVAPTSTQQQYLVPKSNTFLRWRLRRLGN